MKQIMLISVLIFSFFQAAHSQSSVKWEETFDGLTIPPGWMAVDNDNSGSGFDLFQSIALQSGTTILPQSGQSFWSSNYQNASLAGIIDEWLISPQISVIYAGDSLYFWAGAIGGAFDDSLRVWISTTDNQLSSFTHLLGYFRVDGPAGSWHKYGFSLAPFDSCDIYLAVNYYIKDGGPGGQHSDFMWLDHVIITGDPGTINTPPTTFHLINPPTATFLNPRTDSTIHFKWNTASDANGDTLRYKLKILDVFPQLAFKDILDTTYAFAWQEFLNHYTAYRWTMSVTDGRSTVTCPDTFIFFTPPIENLAPYGFALANPPDGDTLTTSDTLVFRWHPAIDPNSDTVTYALHLTGNNLDTTFAGIPDTSFSLFGATVLEAGEIYNWTVMASDSQFTTPSQDTWTFATRSALGIPNEISQIPLQPESHQNYPNPFNPRTVIRFQLSAKSFTTLKVYDITGRKIATLVSGNLAAGTYDVVWDAGNLASGIYIYKLRAGDFIQVRKMLLIR